MYFRFLPKYRKVNQPMKNLHMVSFMLVVIGALNWGLVGLLDLNLVAALFGGYPMIEQVVYILVGLAGVYLALTHKSDCKACMNMKK